jgi:phosphoribosylaminoimidazole-succinocarboxamide synthase
LTTEIASLPRHATGKVRDVYRVGDAALLLVATDRLSAFDVVMRQGIPDKGRVLTQLAAFWFGRAQNITPNHLVSADDTAILARLSAAGVPITSELHTILSGRAMLCRRTQALPVEAVVRGYLSGSAWKEYRDAPVQNGAVDLWGVSLPSGLRESDKLPAPVFTPSTKAAAGHDEPMRPEAVVSLLGAETAQRVSETAIALYTAAHEYVASRGILLADTKFEFGILDGELLLIDEALTPDSSRFWDAETYAPGGAQPSFDKQFVRDYLETVPGWNKQPPPPDLPGDIVAKTAEKYRDAYRRITGTEL